MVGVFFSIAMLVYQQSLATKTNDENIKVGQPPTPIRKMINGSILGDD